MHSIQGADLEKELGNWVHHFKYMLFGVCSGLMESFYLLVLSNNKEIKESELGGTSRLLIDTIKESNVFNLSLFMSYDRRKLCSR